MTTVLITGANRGIGLEHVRQFAEKGYKIHACCRDPEGADALQELARARGGTIEIHRFDQAKPEDAARLAGEIAEPVDILFNNAGINAGGRNFDNAAEGMAETFNVNVIGVLRLTEALVDHVARSDKKIIANQSSKMGSIEDNGSGGVYAYRASKAALNMVSKSLSLDLKDKGITVLALHPGWVQTDMGGPNALITVEESVSGQQRILETCSPDQTGAFLNYDGEPLPW